MNAESGETAEGAGGATQALRSALEALPRRRDHLLPALLAAASAAGWLPPEALRLVAQHVRVPLSEVYATATAYSELRLEGAPSPDGGRPGVCTGVACREAGADALLDALGDAARPVDCRFLCALAPVAESPARRGEHAELHGRCTAERLRELATGEAIGGEPAAEAGAAT